MNEERITAAVTAYVRVLSNRSGGEEYAAWIAAAEACSEDEKVEVNRRIGELP